MTVEDKYRKRYKANNTPWDVGKPDFNLIDVVTAVEPCFELLLLETTRFGSNSPTPPRAWRCLLKKR